MGQQLKLSPAELRQFWAVRQPQMLSFFEVLEKREHWPCKEIERDLSGLVEEVISLLDEHEADTGAEDPAFQHQLRAMNKILAAFPCTAAAYVMVWTEREFGQLIHYMLTDCHRGSQDSAECNVMWQRAQVMARYLLLKEIVEDIIDGSLGQ